MSVALSQETLEHFPLLPTDCATSHKDKVYNCVAWAAARHKSGWWEPFDDAGCCWPKGLPLSHAFINYVKVFELIGYEDCKMDDSLEDGYEKVALFKDASSFFTHVSHQIETGEWTSKLGSHEDIRHASNSLLESIDYGKVAMIMKRKQRIWGISPQTPPEPPPLNFF